MANDQANTLLKTAQSFGRLQQSVNIDIHTHDDGGWFMCIPGFKYDDFNRAGLLNVAKMDRLSQSIVAMKTNTEIDHVIMFMVGRHWTFSPRLYQRAAVNFPMILRWTLTGVGSASLDQLHTYFEDDRSTTNTSADAAADDDAAAVALDREPLATCVFRLVNVDPVTRKPGPMSQFFTAAATQAVVPNGQRFPSFRSPTAIPDHSFRYQVTVRYDDMDVLFHTNVSSYMVYALECATKAAQAGFYSVFDDDIAFYRMKRATSIFISESRAGDELEVSTWEDVDNRMLLNFAIRKNGKMVNFAQLEFYDNSILSVSQL